MVLLDTSAGIIIIDLTLGSQQRLNLLAQGWSLEVSLNQLEFSVALPSQMNMAITNWTCMVTWLGIKINWLLLLKEAQYF